MDSEMNIGSARHQFVYTGPLTLKSCPALMRIEQGITDMWIKYQYHTRTMTKRTYKALMGLSRRLKNKQIPGFYNTRLGEPCPA